MHDNKRTRKGIIVLITIVALIAAGLEIVVWKINTDNYTQPILEYVDESQPEKVSVEIEESIEDYSDIIPQVDLQELMSRNSDVYAYVYVPGTDISYPVLQNSIDDYYLTHGWDKSSAKNGAIYSNSDNSMDFEGSVTVLYGHNMNDGTMFGQLRKFYEEEFFNNNDKLVILTPDEALIYRIVTARRHSDAYLYDEYAKYNEDGLKRFIQMATTDIADRDKDISHIRDVELNTDDKIIVLSTCIKNESTNRYLVIGKLLQAQPSS